MKKNKKVTLVLFIIFILLLITYFLIPNSRTKVETISKDDYKKQLYDQMKTEQDEMNKQEEESEKENEEYIDSELPEVENSINEDELYKLPES